jgi:hypothetical protein
MVQSVPSSYPHGIAGCVFPHDTCVYLSYDMWAFANAVWTAFNIAWVLFLCGAQGYQIALAKTTNETINYYRFDYMTHPDDLHVPAYRRRMMNPFDMGPIANCIDFWGNGAVLKDVSWFDTYQVPAWLMERATKKLQDRSSSGSGLLSGTPAYTPVASTEIEMV